MDDLEALRQKKIKRLQRQQEEDTQHSSASLEDQIYQIEKTVLPYLSKEAVERYGTVKLAHPELAIQSLVHIAQLLQKSTIQQVHDTLYKSILKRLQPHKRDTKIIRK